MGGVKLMGEMGCDFRPEKRSCWISESFGSTTSIWTPLPGNLASEKSRVIPSLIRQAVRRPDENPW